MRNEMKLTIYLSVCYVEKTEIREKKVHLHPFKNKYILQSKIQNTARMFFDTEVRKLMS